MLIPSIFDDRAASLSPVPPLTSVAGEGERARFERLASVVQLGEVEFVARAPTLAAGTHAAGDAEAATLPHRLSTALQGDCTRSADRGDVEGERLGRADV